jgi:hypothetical protein
MAAVILTALGGCRPHYHHAPGGSCDADWEDSSDAELVLLGVEQQGSPEGARLSEPLFTGDRTAFRLNVPEALFVYIVNLAPDGEKSIIWPSDEPRMISGVQRIPEDGGWFTLSGEPGQEVVAIVATRDAQPLDASGMRRVISLVERTADSELTRVQSARPPGILEAGHATMGIRGHGLFVSGTTVRMQSSDPMVMILDVDHRAR